MLKYQIKVIIITTRFLLFSSMVKIHLTWGFVNADFLKIYLKVKKVKRFFG